MGGPVRGGPARFGGSAGVVRSIGVGFGGQPSGFYGAAMPAGFYSGGAMPMGFYGNPPYNFQGGPAGTGASPSGSTPASSSGVTPTPTPPGLLTTWDTVGKTINRAIGQCRLPLQVIWAQAPIWPALVESDTSPKMTFAGAICAPIEPEEGGKVTIMMSGNDVIYDTDQGGIVIPDGLSDIDAAALEWSLTNAVIYPGTEYQMPAPLIVADKGADKTNAFRGIRYIILPLYPLIETTGTGGGGGPISIVWTPNPPLGDDAVVEFQPGTT